MKPNKSLIRNITILSFTLAGISLAIMAYYFLYVDARKDYLDQRNYRVLRRIGENIQAKNETFTQNRRSLYNAELEDLRNFLKEQDSLGNYTEVLADSNFFKTEELRRKHSPLFYFHESIKMEEKREKILFEHQNDWHINYDKIAGLTKGENGPSDVEESISDIMVSVRFEDLMDNLLRKDVFDELLVFQTAKRGDTMEPNLIFSTYEGSFVPYEIEDSLYAFLDRQLDIEKRHIVKNVPYRIYTKPISFHNSQLILCGLIKNERFIEESQYISAFGVLIITLIIAVLLLAFAPLRLAFISKNEQIRNSDILFNTISTILAASLATMLLLDWFSFQQLDRVQSIQQLTTLSKQINEAFKGEICRAVNQLQEYDRLDTTFTQEDYIYSGTYSKDGNAFQKPILTNVLSSRSSLPPPTQYPYFNHIVWVDSLDQIQQEWTIRREPELFYQKGENEPLQPNVSVKGRKYIEKIKLGLAWNISDCGPKQGRDNEMARSSEGESFALEAIRTRTKGENLAVISKQSNKIWEDSNGKKQHAQIVFLSSYLYSVIRPVISPGLGFCIVDEKGNVLFHSDPARNLQENFLDECREPDLLAAIQARTSLNTQGQYLGTEHYLHIEPIGRLPLHIITFQSKAFYRSVHEQILSLTAIFILLSCLSSVIYIGLLILFNPGSYILKRNSFVLDWLRPNLHQGGKYRLLIINNLVTLFLAYVFTINASMVAAVSIIIFSYVATFTSVFLTLNISRYKKFRLSDHGRIIFSVGLLIFFLNLIMLLFWEGWDSRAQAEALKILLFEVLMVGNFLAMRLLLLVSKDFSSKRLGSALRFLGNLIGVNSSYQGNSYIFFLFSWVIIISIFPTFKFFQIAYERENRMVVQHSQMMTAKRIEDRTNWIRQRYHFLDVDSTYISTLPKLGVFYSSFNTTEWEPDSVQADSLIDLESHFLMVERFLMYLRPNYDEWARVTNQVFENNSIWSWEVEALPWSFIISPQKIYFSYEKNPTTQIRLVSTIPSFSFNNTFAVHQDGNGHAIYVGLLIIGFLIILGIIYALIKFSVEKLFAQRILQLPSPNSVALRTTLRQLRSQHLFLVIPPRAIQADYMHILHFEENVLKGEAARKVEYIHLANWLRNHAPTKNSVREFLQSRSSAYDTIVLDYFEEAVDMEGDDINKYKIIADLLEQDKQIIIVSTANPLDIEEVYTPLERAGEDIVKREEYHRNNVKWSELLSQFNKIYYPQEQWEIVQRPFEIKELIQKGHIFLQVPKIHTAELSSNGISAESNYPLSVDMREGKYRLKIYHEVLAQVPVVLLDRNNPKLSLKEKLEEIAELRNQHENGPLLILSNLTPMDIYRRVSPYSISRSASKVSYKRPKGEQGWRLLLSYFYKGMYLMDSARLQKEEEIENIIRLECLHGSYLQEVQYDLVNRLKQKLINPEEDRKSEKIILMIKSQAQLYYHSLWSSCTKDEKFLIHDMAFDGVFNSDNVEAVQSLMRKGIFIKTVNGISLMNRSFQNFILSNVSLTNPVLAEKKSERSGLWNSIRVPISLIVIALAGFLFFTQKEIIDKTLAFTAAIAAFVPTLRTIVDNLSLFKLGGRILRKEKKN